MAISSLAPKLSCAFPTAPKANTGDRPLCSPLFLYPCEWSLMLPALLPQAVSSLCKWELPCVCVTLEQVTGNSSETNKPYLLLLHFCKIANVLPAEHQLHRNSCPKVLLPDRKQQFQKVICGIILYSEPLGALLWGLDPKTKRNTTWNCKKQKEDEFLHLCVFSTAISSVQQQILCSW